ncbi:MAG: phosphonate ABC transporter, permease protein PhnE [Bacillota bacterium]|jgi:phosphonate transport system permease protein|nr:phosphonate ABC transporter, permease protein PhnE [Bacillota bacterium]
MKLKDTIHRDLPKNLLIVLIILALLFISVINTGVDLMEVFRNSDQMWRFLSRFLKPDFSYFPNIIKPMIQTIKMSIYGTFLGVITGLPIAFLGSMIFTKNKTITNIAKFIMGVVRTIPSLLLAAILVAIFGIGEFTGVMTIAIFTFGMTSQLFYQAIDTIEVGAVEAQESVGANKIKVAFYAILPQIVNQIASYTLYAFEVNIRASTVLGYVGAGGIGLIMNTSLGLMRYDRVSLVILTIFVLVFIVDGLSGYLRRKLS